MRLTLDRNALKLLDMMLRTPALLRLQDISPNFQQWKAKDELGARQVIHLQKWLEKKVFQKRSETEFFVPETWTGGLPQVYVDRIVEIVKYYEPLGMLITISAEYFNLLDRLTGKGEDKAFNELMDYEEKTEN